MELKPVIKRKLKLIQEAKAIKNDLQFEILIKLEVIMYKASVIQKNCSIYEKIDVFWKYLNSEEFFIKQIHSY